MHSVVETVAKAVHGIAAWLRTGPGKQLMKLHEIAKKKIGLLSNGTIKNNLPQQTSKAQSSIATPGRASASPDESVIRSATARLYGPELL